MRNMVIQITGHNHWRGGGGGKARERSDTTGQRGVREIFENSCIKMIIFFCTLNVFFSICFTLRSTGGGGGGGGHGPFCPPKLR